MRKKNGFHESECCSERGLALAMPAYTGETFLVGMYINLMIEESMQIILDSCAYKADCCFISL